MPLSYTTPEEAVFSIKLNVASGQTFAAGVVQLKNSASILKSVTGQAAAWITSIEADVVDLGDENAVFFLALAPADAKAPTAHEDFWRVPGRRLVALSKEQGHGVIRPFMPKVLSYKVAGGIPEEQPSAVLVVGVYVAKAVADPKGKDWFFGVRCALRSAGKGFQDGETDSPAP